MATSLIDLKDLIDVEPFLCDYGKLKLEEDFDKIALTSLETNVDKCKEVLRNYEEFENNFEFEVSTLWIKDMENYELIEKIRRCFLFLKLNVAFSNSTQREFLLKILQCDSQEQIKMINSNLEENRWSSNLVGLGSIPKIYYLGVAGPIEEDLLAALLKHKKSEYRPTSLAYIDPDDLPKPPPEAPNAPFPKMEEKYD